MVDVVVIGAGHNGLVASTILARAGLDVVVFESSHIPGGLAGYHYLGGVDVTVGAYVLGIMPQRLIDELKINIKPYKPNPIVVYMLPNGELVRWWVNFNDRVKEFDRFGLGDKLKEMWSLIERFHRAMEKYLFRVEPPSEGELLSDPDIAPFIKLTGEEFLSKYLPREFIDMFTYPVYLDQPAFMTAYYNPINDWYLPTNGSEVGMQVLAKEMYRMAIKSGVKVVFGIGVDKINIEGNSVKGVTLDNGKAVEAKIVLSTASPVNTLLDLVGPEHLSDDVVKRMRTIATYAGGPIKMNIVYNGNITLKGELAKYPESILQLPIGEAVLRGNYLSISGSPSIDDLRDYVDLRWSDVKALEILTPSDYERLFRLRGGIINHVPMTREYMFNCRPVCGWGYSTPIKGLYLGGSGTWPGGQVTGIPGYNAARKILMDLSTNRH